MVVSHFVRDKGTKGLLLGGRLGLVIIHSSRRQCTQCTQTVCDGHSVEHGKW